MPNINDNNFTEQLESGQIDSSNMPNLPAEATDYQRSLYKRNTSMHEMRSQKEQGVYVSEAQLLASLSPEERAKRTASSVHSKKQNLVLKYAWLVSSFLVFMYLLQEEMKTIGKSVNVWEYVFLLPFAAVGGYILHLPIAALVRWGWRK
jgi:hypothetical protein